MRIPPEFDELPLPLKAAIWDAVGNYRVQDIMHQYLLWLLRCQSNGEPDPELVAAQIVAQEIQRRDAANHKNGIWWRPHDSPSYQAGVGILYSYTSFYS